MPQCCGSVNWSQFGGALALACPMQETCMNEKSIPPRPIGVNAKHRVCHRVSSVTPMVAEPQANDVMTRIHSEFFVNVCANLVIASTAGCLIRFSTEIA